MWCANWKLAKVFSVLIFTSFLTGLLLLGGCIGDAEESSAARTGPSDGFDDGGVVTDAQKFVVSGSIVKDPVSGLATIHVNPIVDRDKVVHENLDASRFSVKEDGSPREFFVQQERNKAWTYSNFKILFDNTDSMRDEKDNSVVSLQPFLDFQVCDMTQYLYLQLVFFKDFSQEREKFESAWWQPDIAWSLTDKIKSSGYWTGGNKAENPLNAIMSLWNDPAVWDDGYQRTFLLVTDGPMHQPGDEDSYDHDNTNYSLQDVCNALQDPHSPYKGTVHVVSPETISYRDTGKLAYWDNRSQSWDVDTYGGHANPQDLAACTGGRWFDLGMGAFYSDANKSASAESLLGKDLTLTFQSSNPGAPHDVKVRVRLDNGQTGELSFDDVDYGEFDLEKKPTPPPCDYGSCKGILDAGDSTGDGIYWMDPDGPGPLPRIQTYCDMTGGGWTMVLLSTESMPNAPKTKWEEAVGAVNIHGHPYDLTHSDMLVGLAFWNYLGTTMKVEQGDVNSKCGHDEIDQGVKIAHQAFYDSFSLNPDNYYALSLSGQTVTVGETEPGLYTYHNGRPFSTYDADHDSSSGNCSSYYDKAPFWYGSCWSGSFWGGGKPHSGYKDSPYWTSSGSDYHNWGAIYLR